MSDFLELELYRRPEDPPRSAQEPKCVGGKMHGAVLTADDDPERYRAGVLGPTPNGYQYGYCEDCRCPFRWSVEHQQWVFWPQGWTADELLR